jgi:glycosyltransferase involved in cell wall biosynthesis
LKVGLIVDSLSLEEGTGIARYSQELLNGLKEKGVKVEPIYLKPLKMPYGDLINHIFRFPFELLKRADEFDLIHATAPVLALLFPFIKKPKVVTYFDLASLFSKYSGSALHVRALASIFYRIGKWSDIVIAESALTKEDLVNRLNFPEQKIVVINTGADTRFEPMRRERGRDYFVVGYLGALTLRKRIDYLIRAFYHLKIKYPALKAKLIICGKKNGEYPKLIKLVDELGLAQDVDFKGFIPDKELVETYNSFDVFVHPSEWEGFPIPALEAQRCGVPVVMREDAHIAPEDSPHCLKAKSEEDMADKIYELLTNPSLRDEIARKGLEYSKQFTWERTVEETIKVYEEVLSRGSHSIS